MSEIPPDERAPDAPESDAPEPGFWVTLRRILAFAYPYRYRLGGAIVLVLLGTSVGLVLPLGLRALLDAVFEAGNRRLLNIITLVLLGLFLFQAVVSFAGRYLLGWVGARLVIDLRIRLYSHLHELSLRFFNKQRLGDLTSRLTNDVQSIRSAATGSFVSLLSQVFNLVGSVALMVALNWRLSLVTSISVPVAVLSARYFGRRLRRLSRQVQKELAESTAIAEESLAAVRVVKAFARESYETDRYNTSVENLFGIIRHRLVVSGLFSSILGFVVMSLLVAIFWFGGQEVLADRLTTGDLVAFIMYALNVARSVSSLSRLYTTYNSAVGASEHIFELLDTRSELEDPETSVAVDDVRGAVTFENVWFAYNEGTPVLQDISLHAEAGQTIALVGPSGAGKTTLLNLIPRFYDPDTGRILIDGIDLRDVRRHELRAHMAVVPQDVHLFNASVADNIRYGLLDASDEEIEAAARMGNAHEFITEMADGYDTVVGERGVRLSGGQKQRLSIARAALRKPVVLLLDEATPSLDSASEVLVQQALDRLMRGRTTFIIAHRLSTVLHADCIFVLDQGRIVQRGTHLELIERDGLYRQLSAIQFGELLPDPT